MAAVVMPAVLSERLASVAAMVRRTRLIRGLSYASILVFGTGLAAVLLDASVHLSRGGRGLLLAVWLVVGFLAAWRLILRPMRRPVNQVELAAVVERHFPTLAERLSTLVDLHAHAEPGNGSRQLIFHLAKETAQRSKRLNFHRAVPAWRAVRTGLLSTVLVLLVLSPILYVTGATEHLRRFLLPWYLPTVQVPYRIVVTSGSPVVKRGDSVTMAAYLERTKDDGELPETATLVYREVGGTAEKKLPLAGDDKAAFSVTRPGVTESFEYAVEAGPVRSEWHAVTAADPVDLAEGTTVVVTPPEYARVAMPVKTLMGFGEFEGLERSFASMDLRFTRPAAGATLEWKSASNGASFLHVPLAVAPDGRSAAARCKLDEDGTFRLTLTGDHGLRTDFTVAVRITKDAAPVFDKVVGISEQALEVRPVEKIPVSFAVTDDFAVTKVQIEYTVGNPKGIPRVDQIVPEGLNTPHAAGKTLVQLDDKARDGETLYLRIRAIDNRSIPEEKVFPQESVYPAGGWMKLTLNKSARPLAEQQVNGQRDRIREKLQAALDALAEADRDVAAVKERAKDAILNPDDQARLNNAAEKAREARQELEDAVREAAPVPGLREIATEARKIADNPVQAGGAAARQANNEPKADERGKQLTAARAGFSEAEDRLKKLMALNDALAKARLAPNAFEELAEKEAKLGAETKEREKEPGQAGQLARQQQNLEQDLANAVEKTPALKDAAERRVNEDARKLATEAAKLAADNEDLKSARDATAKAERDRQNSGFAERQMRLAEAAAGLDDQSRTAAAVAGADPFERAPFNKAAEALRNNATVPAMTEQEKAARELDKLAAAMDQAAAARSDPKAAAGQLARWQEDLNKRVAEYTKNDSFDKLPKHVKDRINQEQGAIAKAAAGLTPPPGDDASGKAKAEAVDQLAKASKAVSASDGDPTKSMRTAAESLAELAKKMPDRIQRLKSARAELNKILDEQTSLARQADAAVRSADKSGATPESRDALARKLADVTRKQDELAKRVKDLDVPGLESRKEKAGEAAGRAGDDLRAGLPQDIPASQKDLSRQLDRLKQAVDGQTPSDELAKSLARRQRELATEFAKPGGDPLPQDLDQLQRLQRQINKDLTNLSAPESPELEHRARQAAQEFEKAMREKDDVDELRKKSKDAADTLDKLADRMAGAESDAERVERLRRNREQAAAEARQQAGKGVDPDAGAKAQKQVQRDLDELGETRAGAAQSAKQKAAEELSKLARSPGPDRQAGQQQAAADALAELSRQMKQNGDRTAAKPQPGPETKEDVSGLPTTEKADAARKLAREQRELRNELSRATEQSGKVRPAGDPSRLMQLEKEQEQIAKEAGQLTKEAADAATGESARKAAQVAERAAGQLAAGGPAAAKKSADEATQALADTARAGGGSKAGQKAAELAAKQEQLAKQIGEAAGNDAAATARQAHREKELSGRAGKLADGLDAAAGEPKNGARADDLKAAADAARNAQRQLDRAGGESAAGRPGSAADARKAADGAVRKAKDHSAKAAGGTPGDGDKAPGNGKAGERTDAALDSAKAADRAMKQAREELGKGNAAGAKGQMDKAEKALRDTAKNLSPDGAGEGGGNRGKGGNGGGMGGDESGKNDGSAEAPVSSADIAPDLKAYVGKPWGEIPGEIRARIVQDLKAKYGEDYARIINLYFTELANRK